MRLSSLWKVPLSLPLKAVGLITRPITQPIEKRILLPMFKDLAIKFAKESLYAVIPVAAAALLQAQGAFASAHSDNPVTNLVLLAIAALLGGGVRAVKRAATYDLSKK